MRPFVACVLVSATLVAFAPHVRADDVVAETAISAVTVYPDRATVTRTATVELPAGASSVVVNGLPETVFTDSLRAEGTTSGDVVLGAIENKRVSSVELAAPRERELSEKLQALGDQRALVEADQKALQQKQQFLSTLSQQAALRTRENIAEMNLKPEQWTAAADTLAGSLADVMRAVAAKGVELRTLDEQMAAVQTALNQLQTGARNSLQVRVPLEAKAPTRLTLKVSYQLPNATWTPVYDARLETGTGKLTLTQFGDVRQQTGEDWHNVKLTLSTAQPARGAALPPLNPMWVNLYQPQVYNESQRVLSEEKLTSRSNLAGQGVMADMAAPMVAAAPEERAVAFRAATINTGGFVSEYVVAGATDVLADGTARKVLIGSLDVASEVMVKVKPQVAPGAFLIAATKLGGETPLLPGSASLFRDGAYIGSLDLPLLRPGEQTDLGFGIDDQVVVKQRVLKDETGESGVISRDATRTRHTITEIQNLHRSPVKVVVLQTVPVPRNARIGLSILPDLTLAGYEKAVDNIPGQLRWTLTLAPQQKQEVGLGWTLNWPKESALSGLPF